MKTDQVSPLWKWFQALVVVVGLVWIGSWLVGPAGNKDPEPIAPRPTLKPPPDACWYVPDKWGGVQLDCPYDGLTAEQRRAYDEYQNRLYDEYLADRYGALADAEATREALIEELFDAQMQQEAQAYATAEEHTRREATIEAELWGTGSISASPSDAAPAADRALLLSVTDGDSIVVNIAGNSYRVRYIGIDTPEYGQYGFAQATDVNRQLLASGPLRLEKDVSETDQYGRLLRYVFAGDVFVNAELVRRGYAQAATYPPDVAHADLFVQLEREARQAGRGLWAE
ncbi:MAG TPA: thermonuclease family protein [Anaerolineae bacterium]|nr:thermonuclease family protein [Anaerolineae bacterium]